ncbi:NADH:flavin oxidoreductase, partial [Chloroflexota bacterium]
MEIRNRIVMPPMGTSFHTEDGYVTDGTRTYYEERAKGGVGLVIVEYTYVHSSGRASIHQLSIDSDKRITRLSTLAQAIKRHGARAAIQLHHAGYNTRLSVTGQQPVAPSPVALPGMEVPRELTTGEIQNMVALFAQAAWRAKEAGFDAVELHGAHKYLIAQFLSPASNKRCDIYGGSLENRARFLLEVIKAIKAMVGPGFPVWSRINGEEVGMQGGLGIEEVREVVVMAERAGMDAVHVSGMPAIRGPFFPIGWGVHNAEVIKKGVSIPVIVVGKLNPELAERVLEEGKADLVSMGRPLIADPELPNKMAEGRLDDIRPCIYCSICASGIGTQCSVNPAVGQERVYAALPPATVVKKVIVVGGGPAGMEAARVAALRGCKVEL